jgi:hypothetical protein
MDIHHITIMIYYIGQFAGIYGTGAAVGNAAGRRRLSTFNYIDPINDNIYGIECISMYRIYVYIYIV